MKYIIWDWNGTLFEDLWLDIDIQNVFLRERNLKTIDDLDYYYSVFCFPVINYYINLGYDFEKEDWPTVADAFIDMYTKRCHECDLKKGAEQALENFKNKGFKQCILSASSQKSLEIQMSKFSIHHYFEKIMGISDNFAKSKIDVGLKFIKDNNISPSDITVIGDTVHDFEVAKAMGAKCILIQNGHCKQSDLLKTGAIIAESILDVPDMV